MENPTETQRLLMEFAAVNHNRVARCRTTKGAIKSQDKTIREYAEKLKSWICFEEKLGK